MFASNMSETITNFKAGDHILFYTNKGVIVRRIATVDGKTAHFCSCFVGTKDEVDAKILELEQPK